MFLVYVVAAVATLLLEVSLAQYSLSISEDQLQSYYSNTAHADLVQGESSCEVHVYIHVVA